MKRRVPLFIAAGLLTLCLVLYPDSGKVRKGRGAGGEELLSSGRPLPKPAESPADDSRREEAAMAHPASAVAMAAARKRQMLEWMEKDPQRALAEALSRHEYAALPEELKPYYEQRFNSQGSLRVMPICTPGATVDTRRTLELDGRRYEASVIGQRTAQTTKLDAPLAGIVLDGRAVIAESPLEIPQAGDESFAMACPPGQGDPGRDFGSGAALGSQQVVALAGGKRYHFRDREAVDAFNRRLARAEMKPGPESAARGILASPADAGDGQEAGEPGNIRTRDVNDWTETPKKVFYIRAKLPGGTNNISKATLLNELQGKVKTELTAMSYGKTTIDPTVSEMVVTLPKGSFSYLPDKNELMHDDAVAAYEAIAGAGALDEYDIIGVQFPSFGMKSGGVTYDAAAELGGPRQWYQSAVVDSHTLIHEFGHNYGVHHAGFWQTSGPSPIGGGSSDEYGDYFDYMGMGSGDSPHFHMAAKSRLNWLEESQWFDVDRDGSGVRRIHRFNHPDTTGEKRGIRVSRDAANGEYLWIGYRAGVEWSRWSDEGAYVLWQQPGQIRSCLLDMTPASWPGRSDAPLVIGRTFSDTTAGIHITPLAKGGSGADAWLDVNVQQGSFPGNRAPVVSLAIPEGIAPRTPVLLQASASDPDGDELAYLWDFSDYSYGPSAPTVEHSWVAGGSYTVKVTVSDMKGATATASMVVNMSDPATTWTDGTLAAERTLLDLAYLRGRFIAAGNQYVHFSIDGQSWREQSISPGFISGAITCDDAGFVIVGSDLVSGVRRGAILRSVDGRSWQPVVIPDVGQLKDVVAGDGIMIAVGDSGGMLRSTDGGQVWTLVPRPSPAYFHAIAWGGGVFVIRGSYQVFTSPDGLAWTDRTSGSGFDYNSIPGDLLYHQGAFFEVGGNQVIMRSTDGGSTWQQLPVAGRMSQYRLRSLAVGAGILWSPYSAGPPASVFSADGQIWREVLAPQPYLEPSAAVAFGNGVFMAVHAASGTSGTNGRKFTSASFYPENRAPEIHLSGPPTARPGQAITFSPALSDADGDALILLWDMGDGSALKEGSAISHSYASTGSYTVRVTATDTRGGIRSETVALNVRDPWAEWQQLHFPGNPPLSGPEDDYDHDGVPNLGEYKTGTDPKYGGHRTDWNATYADGFLTIIVPKAADTGDVGIAVEYSPALGDDWSSSGVTIVEDSATQLVAKIPGGDASGFVRLVFQQQ